MSGKGEKKDNTDYTGEDNDPKDQAQWNRRLVKSNPSKTPRITLGCTKPAATTRPPWNSGASPSPTNTKASAAERTARTLPRKLPIRGKLPTQQEFSSPQETQQAPVLKATQPAPSPTTEPRKSAITPKAASDFMWAYDLRKAFLEKAGGTTSAAKHVESSEVRSNADAALMGGADITKDLRHAFALAQMLTDGGEEDSFLDSEVMTSPRLKLPLPSPAPTTTQSSPSKATYPSVTSIPTISKNSSLKDLLARERHRAIELPVLPQDEYQKGSLMPTQGQQCPPFQRDAKLCDNALPALKEKPHSTTAMEKTYSPIPRQWFTVRIDPDTSDNERTVPRAAVPPVPSMINKPSLGARAQPHSHVGAWDQFAENERLFGLKTDYDENIYTMPINRNDPQYEQKAAVADKIAREIEVDFPCHADGESNGEEDESKSRSKMNRSRRLRQSRSRSSIKSVKWDPAIIAYGPKNEIKDGQLEYFRKTLNHLKKVDRKAIRDLLEALKNLDSDEDEATKTKQAFKEGAKESNTGPNAVPVKGLNPRAPAFRERSSRESTDDSQQEPPFLSVTRKRARNGETHKDGKLAAAKENTETSKAIPHAVRSYPVHIPALPKQEPIWINTFQPPPIIIDQEDDDFKEFCRAHNFIPLEPVNLIPIIPPTPAETTSSLNTPYIAFKLDPIRMAYTPPFDGMDPTFPLVQTSMILPLGDASDVPHSRPGNVSKQSYRAMATQDLICLLEETSEPIEDRHREARALAPAWGAQILENFVKKYPMTGQRKPEDAILEQKENQKTKAKVQQTKCPKFEGKSGEGNPFKRAAEIQQKLEMLLLRQREKKAPLVPAHKIKATEIQQTLEIMLYKFKEQKALESFSKRVPQRADGRCSDKSSDIELGASRSTSHSSKGTLNIENVEKLR